MKALLIKCLLSCFRQIRFFSVRGYSRRLFWTLIMFPFSFFDLDTRLLRSIQKWLYHLGSGRLFSRFLSSLNNEFGCFFLLIMHCSISFSSCPLYHCLWISFLLIETYQLWLTISKARASSLTPLFYSIFHHTSHSYWLLISLDSLSEIALLSNASRN